MIEDIIPTTPLGTDAISNGDDEIRQLKTDITEQFTNLGAIAVNRTADEINDLLTKTVLTTLYPVGSVFIGADPTGVIGGTWAALEDLMLIGASATYPAGSTGGSADVTKVLAHTHTGNTDTEGAHTHTVPTWDDLSGGSGVDNAGVGNTTTTSAGSDHLHAFTTDSTGDAGVGDNLPPYRAVLMWEGTA